eukprot:CAMPEP_0179300790 /NCGR_PEP_ID=MMETSP0797-20121207/47222_1 /TAXON_ID=47934 /ORGANISM="Dinophysis acuminata, Strain DAEP01" /LENGTH=271 /DNA_ID=CAMNT_0021010283 /DNA_START=13 /DNA_END=824 /DNA_ORIENTATION=-
MESAILLILIALAQSLNLDTSGGPRTEVISRTQLEPHSISGPWSQVPWRLQSMPTSTRSGTELHYLRSEIVDLDLPPAQRWIGILSKYREEVLPYFRHWQQVFDTQIGISQDALHDAVWERTSPEWRAELRGIVRAMNDPAVTLRFVTLLSGAIYDLGLVYGCSQLVAAAADGTVLHGRSMDLFEVAPAVEVTFLRRGRVLFVSTMWLGHIGVHTAIKPGAWSFGSNTRYDARDNQLSALARLRAGSSIQYFFVRELFQQDLGYEEAVRAL